jgi:hypothetical protein
MLWPLSVEGEQVGNSLPVIGGDDGQIAVGWSGNLLVSQADLDFSPGAPETQAVTRVSNGSVQRIATCDAKAPMPCPSFQSIAVAPNQQYAYGISVTSTGIQLLKISWSASDAMMTFSDTGIIPSNLSASDQLFVDPSGQYLLQAAFSGKEMRAFRIEGTSGALTEVSGSPFATPGTILDLVFLPQS